MFRDLLDAIEDRWYGKVEQVYLYGAPADNAQMLDMRRDVGNECPVQVCPQDFFEDDDGEVIKLGDGIFVLQLVRAGSWFKSPSASVFVLQKKESDHG